MKSTLWLMEISGQPDAGYNTIVQIDNVHTVTGRLTRDEFGHQLPALRALHDSIKIQKERPFDQMHR